ncbi:metallo-beta-lactamase domain-containing protein 1 [Cuculus canorus]|uniref:metallo-beta-lactamase domain-containing protein 1 n=1 Tax=Cuculus canorus TaxID=55661 RepID=UPI0023AB4D90|nr:metallo-beta-lactamase domain-containing protein 1 [Cuculus canorus]
MRRGVRTSPLGGQEVGGPLYSLRVLQEGFNHPRADGSFHADGSITLIRGGPITAVVDTGGPWARSHLLRLLARQGLSPDQVTHVICTHGHSDHVGNVNLFPGADLLVGFDLSRGYGFYQPNPLVNGVPYVLHPGHLEVVPTPGHTMNHVSLVVRETTVGTVVVAGDLFEKEEDEEEWRALSEDPTRQEKSRRWALEVADVIVPGHGPPFRVFREWGRGEAPWGDGGDDDDEGGEGPKGPGGVLGGGGRPERGPKEELEVTPSGDRG